MSGLADAPNTGGVVAGIEARFARADEERRRELDRLIKAGARLNTEPRMPSMQDEKGEQMAKREPKKCCGSLGPRCLSACKEGGKKATEKPARLETIERAARKVKGEQTPRLVRVASSKLFDAAEATVEQLVETIEACKAELVGRQDQVERQLEAIRKAIGEAA